MTEPYYQDAYVTLYHGDCREITEWMQADVLVTDPPYGIAWARNLLGRGKPNEKWYDSGIQNDGSTETRDVVLEMWGDRPAFVFGSLLLPPPRRTKQVAIYGKPKNAGTRVCIGGVRRDVEAIYLLGNHEVTGGGRTAIFQTGAGRVSGGKATDVGAGLVQRYRHPHAKPVDVLEELIKLAPEGVIADPFAGSGSTLVAARNLGRNAIGVEVEERYCEVIAERLAQQTLFEGVI